MDALTAKADRLTQLRKAAKLARKEIAKMAGVSVFTYKGWENARFGGIPEKRAHMLVNALLTEGIQCSVDWILYGLGTPPNKVFCCQCCILKDTLVKQAPAEDVEQLAISKTELELFCNNYPL